jgi:membrane associated rhomboid family serine protease
VFTPLSIDVPYSRIPWACLVLIGLMVGATVLASGAEADDVAPYLLTPGNVEPWQPLTSLFLHADTWHLCFNALYLWVFGRYVEDRVGPARFVLLFVLFGLVADAAYLWWGQGLPALGASGAIAGMMTLALFQAPRAGMLVSLGWIPWMSQRPPVWLLVGLWLVNEILFLRDLSDGVAHAAHLGGAFAGCLAAWVLRASWLKETGWHFPREPNGGARVSAGFHELMSGEAAWKAIYERMRRQREMRGE